VIFSNKRGFCNHCGSHDVYVRHPWSAKAITLCMNCYIAFAEAQDNAAAAMRAVRRQLEGESV
jgi:hypothetical protein